MNLAVLARSPCWTAVGWARQKCCRCNCYSHTVACITLLVLRCIDGVKQITRLC